MRNFIYSIIQNLNADILDMAAFCVCSGLAMVAAAVFGALRIVRAPSYKLASRVKKFTAKHGTVTAANACRFGKKVIKPCGRSVYSAYVYALRFGGVKSAGRAVAPLVCAQGRKTGGFFALGAASVLTSCAAFALSGYSFAAGALGALGVAAVWLIGAGIYAVICAAARAAEVKKGAKAADMTISATSPAPADADVQIAENPAFVAKSDLDKFFAQADALISAGVSKQVAAAMLGGIQGMLDSDLYCGAERLRLAALKERVKKICA